MNLVEFLKDLSMQNVELWIEGVSVAPPKEARLRYRGPKDVLTPTLLNKIKQHKAELLQLLREGFYSSTSYPLSHGQQGLWFLYQLAPESAAYNVAFTARIRSDLNIPALQRAFDALIVRHPTLRTTFKQRGAELVQEVHGYQKVCFEEIDTSTWNWDEITKSVVEAYRRPFDLERGPVLRVNLFTRSAQDHILLLTIHHIAVDGFSFGILLDELRLLYQAQNTGQALSLPPINWQYQDFVQWQQKMLASSVGEHLWSYWQKQLDRELPVLKLPTDRPRPPIQNYQGASYTFDLNKELTSRLRELAKTLGATLYMTFLAAFGVLLHRYTNQEDIIIGSPTEGRSQPEFARTVGFFVNMLALRVNLAGNPTFSELLTQVRHTVLNALTHQDYPTPLLIERLHINRDPTLPGLFRVSFNLLKLQDIAEDYELSVSNRTKTKPDWGGLSLEPFVISQQEGQNDLVFDMMETTESLLGIFRYNTDLFDTTTMSRMADHFQNLLLGIVVNPHERISLLPLLTATERHHLLEDWNNTQVEYPQDKCIHQLFEAQVELTPDAVAVVFANKQLTYQELNARANKIAHYLQALGVGPEVLVGICVERSLEMIVGLLGILKAGGAYVPLDPAYPKERLAGILEDTQLGILLTQERFQDKLPDYAGKTICLDTDWSVIAQHSTANPISKVQLQNLAYIIYTSGSTGKPKGVMIEHRSLINFVMTATHEYGINAGERILQFASICFDTSIEEIFPSLLVGATLVLRTEQMLHSSDEFWRCCREWQLTVLDLPTAYWHQLVAELNPQDGRIPASLKIVIIGGEEAQLEKVKHWHTSVAHLLHPPQLFNSYGPTEATVITTLHCLNSSAATSVAIGRPISNAQVYVLDQYLQPVPIGVPGELHISGTGLARGYWQRPELTAEKFIKNPFYNSQFKIQNSKLYKTGDIARFKADGNLEYLGRVDDQVKIRGFRIELGEVEAILSQHQTVRETVVIVREDQPNNKRLVAYIVPKQEQPSNSELRHFLKQKLPDFMVPSAFVMLDKLPLLPNGKVNRQALLAPDKRPDVEAAYVAPQTETERLIATVWQQTLQIEKVGVDDNFFELGGHSLLLVQIHNKLREIFKQELSMVDLFKYPTISYLAKYLSQEQSEKPAFAQSQDRAVVRSVRRDAINQQSQLRQKHRAQKKQ